MKTLKQEMREIYKENSITKLQDRSIRESRNIQKIITGLRTVAKKGDSSIVFIGYLDKEELKFLDKEGLSVKKKSKEETKASVDGDIYSISFDVSNLDVVRYSAEEAKNDFIKTVLPQDKMGEMYDAIKEAISKGHKTVGFYEGNGFTQEMMNVLIDDGYEVNKQTIGFKEIKGYACLWNVSWF